MTCDSCYNLISGFHILLILSWSQHHEKGFETHLYVGSSVRCLAVIKVICETGNNKKPPMSSCSPVGIPADICSFKEHEARTTSVLCQSPGSAVRSGHKYLFRQLPGAWSWANYLASLDFNFPYLYNGVIVINLIKWKKKMVVSVTANMLHFLFAKYQTFTKSFTCNISVHSQNSPGVGTSRISIL